MFRGHLVAHRLNFFIVELHNIGHIQGNRDSEHLFQEEMYFLLLESDLFGVVIELFKHSLSYRDLLDSPPESSLRLFGLHFLIGLEEPLNAFGVAHW